MIDAYRKNKPIDIEALKEEAAKIYKASDEEAGHAEPDTRNLIAHAGLEKYITLITSVDEDICLEYREDIRKRLDKIVESL